MAVIDALNIGAVYSVSCTFTGYRKRNVSSHGSVQPTRNRVRVQGAKVSNSFADRSYRAASKPHIWRNEMRFCPHRLPKKRLDPNYGWVCIECCRPVYSADDDVSDEEVERINAALAKAMASK